MNLRQPVLALWSGLLVLGVLHCGGTNDRENDEVAALVSIRGQAQTGTTAGPIANAVCQFAARQGELSGVTTADAQGRFQVRVPVASEGFLGCFPPGFPNLLLATFVSTLGVAAEATVPAQGVEEVSPRTTVVANIIAQSMPEDPQARKLVLLQELAVQEPDLSMLAGAATALFQSMLQGQVADVSFSTGEGGSESAGDAGDGTDGTGDAGGVAGDVGDGGELSPLPHVLCEFTRNLHGDSALEDLLDNGRLDLASLQAITLVPDDNPALGAAFTRFFPQGLQPLAAGRPLRAFTNAQGAYTLPVPPETPGFVRCLPRPELAIAAAIAGRPRDTFLMQQDVSPPSHVFAALLLPQVAPAEVPDIQANFLEDIGNLREPSNGVVRVETIQTPTGPVMADADGDGVACAFLGGPQAAMVTYPAAGGLALMASTLYKALLLEARASATADYTALLAAVLTRATATGEAFPQATGADLTQGGVTSQRSPELAATWNACVRTRIEQDLGIPLAAAVRAGRLRLTVRLANGLPAAQAQITVSGAFVAASTCTPTGTVTNGRLVCPTDNRGQAELMLRGERTLTRTPLAVEVRAADGTLLVQTQTDFVPATTRNLVVTGNRN